MIRPDAAIMASSSDPRRLGSPGVAVWVAGFAAGARSAARPGVTRSDTGGESAAAAGPTIRRSEADATGGAFGLLGVCAIAADVPGLQAAPTGIEIGPRLPSDSVRASTGAVVVRAEALFDGWAACSASAFWARAAYSR